MGRMKELFIDKMNEDRNGPDDTDWNYEESIYEPEPIAVASDGKKCWEIKSIVEDVTYRVWGHTYKQAIENLSRIESL